MSARRATQSPGLRALIVAAEAQGWAVESTGSCHLRWIPPDRTRPIVHSAATPSDWQAVANLRSQLRRSGLRV